MGNGQRLPALEADAAEKVVTERAGEVAWKLATGERLSNQDIQAMTGLGRSGAWLMMGRLSRVLPILFYDGVWSAMFVAEAMADGFEGDPPMR